MWYSSTPVLTSLGAAACALHPILTSLLLSAPVMLPPAGDVTGQRTTICDRPAYSLPANIHLENGLEPIVRWMLEHSATFRQQCRALAAAPHVSARVRYAMRAPGAASRARAVFRERSSGVLTADIELGLGADLVELIGHEFEHLLEQLDRVDLRGLARAGLAVRMPDGAYETTRAITAGRRVSAEVVDTAPDGMRRASGSIWRAVRRVVSGGR